jgi:hypothetical protein
MLIVVNFGRFFTNKNAIAEKALSVRNSDTFQAGTESSWLEVMQNALKAYVIESNSKLKSVSPSHAATEPATIDLPAQF